VARCTVARLMPNMGIEDAVRGKSPIMTISNKNNACPRDLVRREFNAIRPYQLWVCDFTYVSTWCGFVYVAFVIDASEQTIHARQTSRTKNLIHHSDRGVQYVSIKYTERLAESIIGLYKTEVIRRRRPWKHLEQVEFATLEWVDWFNNRRLLEAIGDMPPAELEKMYYQKIEESAMAA